jgi:plasmid stabilization system protein ParE
VKAVRFHEAARAELIEETRHYARISRRLGERLAGEIEKAIRLAAEFPEMGSPYKHGTRRVFPRRFPFSIVYVVRETELYVIAIAPFRREPGYWRRRAGVR